MSELDTLIAGFLDDVKKGKHKKKRKKGLKDKKVIGAMDTGSSPVINPWTEEALVCIMQVTSCETCGNAGTAWLPWLYVERSRVLHRRRITQLERITNCNVEPAYGSLPKRIEVRNVTTCFCPHCFGDLPNGVHYQQQLSFNMEVDNDLG